MSKKKHRTQGSLVIPRHLFERFQHQRKCMGMTRDGWLSRLLEWGDSVVAEQTTDDKPSHNATGTKK